MRITYLSQSEAGRRLGVTRQRIHTLIGLGRIRSTLIAGRILITEAELARFAAIPRRPYLHL